jgi:class 3 adenylate cyclase
MMIGRNDEQRWLLERLDEAEHGAPQVVVLRGEAGVGKSRLARALVEAAAVRGVTTSIGRFREQHNVPYEAFTDGILRRVADAARDREESDAGRFAAARDVFADTIRDATGLVVLDDMQWADVSSAELLVNLVRMTADMAIREPARVLLLLAVRDGPDVAEPGQLDLIRRENITTSLTLHGLSELDVSRLAKALGASDLSRPVVAELTRVTSGNPLFVGALVKQMTASTPTRLPSEVQHLIGSRVAALSAQCQDMLAAVGVLGSGWDLSELEALTGFSRPVLIELLDEAEAADVLVTTDRGDDFAHPLYEHAVLSTLTATRRRETHCRVADVLIARRRAQPSSSPLPIAQHLLAAGTLADPTLVLEYCRSAGEAARTALAWDDATRFYRAALDAADELGVDDHSFRFRLSLDASVASLQSGDAASARQCADDAIGELGPDPVPENLAAAWIERVRADLFQPSAGAPVDTGPLEHLATGLETPAPEVAARVWSNLAPVYWAGFRVDEAREACRRAIDLGTRTGEHAACADGWGQLAITQWMRLELADAAESLEAASRAAAESGERQKLGNSTTLLPLNLFWLGRLDDADSAIDRAWATTRQVSYSLRDGFVLVARALVSAARGMYVESDAAVDDALEIGRLTGYQWPTSLILPVLASTRALRGDIDGTQAVLDEWAPPEAPGDRSGFARLLRYRSGAAEPPTVEELAAFWQSSSSFPTMSTDTAAAFVIETAFDIDAPELVDAPASFLADLEARGQVFTTTMGFFIPRVLGLAAAVRGENARASERLREAVDRCRRLRAHAELAQCQYVLAAVLDRRRDAVELRTALREAHERARALGLHPLAQRCERLAAAAELSPVLDHPSAAARIGALETAVVLFTDIANSVQLTEELGDWVFHDRARALQQELRSTIRSFSGSPVEGIKLGDGILAEFRSAERAVACAVDCRDRAQRAALPLHIGVHAGDIIRDGGDIFGGTVNTAARICAYASAGEVLASGTVRELARTSASVTFTTAGAPPLKGIAEPVPLYSVHAAS